MAVYICSKCLFCFERTGNFDLCPDCGNANVQYATDEEITEYRRNRAELDSGRERGAVSTKRGQE